LVPMVEAVNALFGRIGVAIARERAFTEDAAHELRTPLAVLRAQWDVLRRTAGASERESAAANVGAGLERMERLVTQMLALSRLESTGFVIGRSPIDWRAIVEDVFSDCLPLAVARNVELACEWPPGADAPIAVDGDPELLRVMLRNLLDNAARYAPPGSTVTVRVAKDRVEIENAGSTLTPEVLARFGERFFRPEGQESPGSGLGVSIVKRIAALHGLEATWTRRRAGDGVSVTLRAAAGGPATSAREPFAAARALPRGAPRPRPGGPDEAAPRARARST
ncbi:MAG TPA: ATP-binding protein, partial [Burkholderiaceae bacterium]|nr:ATP-binding protein [Burkholderiaceae bacterium]